MPFDKNGKWYPPSGWQTPTLPQPVVTPAPPPTPTTDLTLAERLRAALRIGQPYTGLAPQVETILPGDIAPPPLPMPKVGGALPSLPITRPTVPTPQAIPGPTRLIEPIRTPTGPFPTVGGAVQPTSYERLPGPAESTLWTGLAEQAAAAREGKPVSLPAKAVASFQAGMGDVLASAGGAAKWLGATGLGEQMVETGTERRERFEVPTEPFTWKQLLNPKFYAVNVVRSIPFSLSFIPVALLAGYATGAAAAATTLGAFGKTLLSAVGAGTVSRAIESALEAGSTYEEALRQGMTPEQADAAADQTFKGNLTLVGLDIGQMALWFSPLPTAGIVGKAVSGVQRFAGGGASEAVEEIVQEYVQKRSLGSKETFGEMLKTPEMQEAGVIGLIHGTGFGGLGTAVQTINTVKDRVFNTLPQTAQAAAQETVNRLVGQGMSEDEAKLKVLDRFAETENGRVVIERVAKEVIGQVGTQEQAAPTPTGPAVTTPTVAPPTPVPTAVPVPTQAVKPPVAPVAAPTPVAPQPLATTPVAAKEAVPGAPQAFTPGQVLRTTGQIQLRVLAVEPDRVQVQQLVSDQGIPVEPTSPRAQPYWVKPNVLQRLARGAEVPTPVAPVTPAVTPEVAPLAVVAPAVQPVPTVQQPAKIEAVIPAVREPEVISPAQPPTPVQPTPTVMEAKLRQLGYSVWERGDKRRVYINDPARWLGLETQHYKTGNISSATLNGERISNSKATRILRRFENSKLWFDLGDGKFHTLNIQQADLDTITAAIRAEPVTPSAAVVSVPQPTPAVQEPVSQPPAEGAGVAVPAEITPAAPVRGAVSAQAQETSRLRAEAQELRDRAEVGLNPEKNLAEAERLENEAKRIEYEQTQAYLAKSTKLQPRAQLYADLFGKFDNQGYMAWISEMSERFDKERGVKGEPVMAAEKQKYQDDFTEYLRQQAATEKPTREPLPPAPQPVAEEPDIRVGDIIGDGLIRGEVLGEATLGGKRKWPAWRVRILSGHEAGKESFIMKDQAKRLGGMRVEEKPSLAATEARLAEAVNVAVGEVEVPIGGSLKIVETPPVGVGAQFAGADAKARFTFSDPELERIHQEAHGVKPEGLRERLGDIADEVYRRATREFEFLPHTPEFQRLRFALNQLKKQKGIQSAKTVDILRGVLIEMEKNPEAYDLFERKVLLSDLREEISQEHELPNKWTPEGVETEIARIEAAMQARPEVERTLVTRKDTWTSLKSEYIAAQKAIGHDVKHLTREDYFRHQVLDHAQHREARGIGKRLRTPTGRPFLQKREGGTYIMNTNYLEAEYEVMQQMLYDIQVAKVIKLVDDEFSIHRKLKERAKELSAERGKPVDWRTLLPEGYKLWQAREGNIFYMANTISERLAMGIAEGTLDAAGLNADQIKSALAMGGKRTEFAVKAEVADTLDNMGHVVTGHLTRALRGAVGIWKEWQLISPPRYLKYNIRNMSGDAEAMWLGNPSAFKKVPQAVKELAAKMFRHKVATGRLAEFIDFGGLKATQQVAELKTINQLEVFANMLERKPENIAARVLKGYWRTVRLTTDFRELILRYAAYLDFAEQLDANNGRPKNWGASDPELVMALETNPQKAFMLSNQLLGAYDEVSVMTQNLRQGLAPFFSFKEVNAKRYIQLMKNVNLDVKATTALGKKVTIGLKRSPFLVWKAGTFVLRMAMAWGIVQAYNLARFPDEERDLPDDVRRRPHIILGRDEDGQVRYFDRLGILREFTEWFVDDEAEKAVQDWLNGKATLYQAVRALVVGLPKAAFNQAIQALGPLKTAVEAGVGKSYYPNVFEPSTIRDKGAFLARSLSLGDLYSAVMGLPQRSWTDILERMVYYKADPGESAYWDVRDDVREFQEKIGKASYYGGTLSPRSNALYNLKLSLRYGDKTAAEKYLTEYYVLGGTDQGLKTSLESMHPFSGLSQAEQAAFLYDLLPDSAQKKLAPQLKETKLADALTLIVQALPDATRNRLRLALQFYEQALFGKSEATETTPQ